MRPTAMPEPPSATRQLALLPGGRSSSRGFAAALNLHSQQVRDVFAATTCEPATAPATPCCRQADEGMPAAPPRSTTLYAIPGDCVPNSRRSRARRHMVTCRRCPSAVFGRRVPSIGSQVTGLGGAGMHAIVGCNVDIELQAIWRGTEDQGSAGGRAAGARAGRGGPHVRQASWGRRAHTCNSIAFSIHPR